MFARNHIYLTGGHVLAGYVPTVEYARVNNALPGICVDVTEIPQAECEALVVLYNSTNDANCTNNDGWLVTNTPCSWHGLSCDGTGHVTSMQLPANNLTGALPSEFADLSQLRYAYLQGNNLTDAIPSALGNMPQLLHLFLSLNDLTGTIPLQLGDLDNLGQLLLSGNRLSGPIPSEIGSLSKLISLRLEDNAPSGPFPASITLLGLLDPHAPTMNGVDFGHNMLSSSDPTVIAFLGNKDPDWADTQTVPPANVAAAATSDATVELTWTPIPYSGDGGGYEVSHATAIGGPYTVAGTTADKAASSYAVNGLTPNTTYYFFVRTHTPPP